MNKNLLLYVLAFLLILTAINYWQVHQQLAHLWMRTVMVNVVDDASGAHLPCSIGGIPGSGGLPLVTIGGSTAEIPSISVAADEPLTLEIGSAGYQEQPLTIGDHTAGGLTVRLKKK